MTRRVVQNCGPHGIPSYTDDAGTVHVATGGRCAGPAVPIPPDAARDARRAAYAARERERATAALDRYMSEKYPRLSMTASQMMDVFGAFRAGYAASEEHHKSHYGVQDEEGMGRAGGADLLDAIREETALGCRNQDHEHFPGDPLLQSCGQHHGVGILPNAYRCLGCSFVTASAGRVVEHVNATGHMIEGNG